MSQNKKIKVGYIRVSTEQQVLDRQRMNIKEACPEAVIVEEKYTGTTMKRPNWSKLMVSCEKGNISDIYFDEPSRMGRTADDCFATYKHLYLDLGINLYFLKGSHINTNVYSEQLQSSMKNLHISSEDAAADRMINSIFEAINEYMLELVERQIRAVFQQAENEARTLGQRTKSGLAAAKRRGVTFNNSLGLHYKNKEEWRCRYLIIKYHVDFGGCYQTDKVAQIIKHSKQCTLKYLETIKVEQGMLKQEDAKYAESRPYNHEIACAEEFKEQENLLWEERFGRKMKSVKLVKNQLGRRNMDMQE